MITKQAKVVRVYEGLASAGLLRGKGNVSLPAHWNDEANAFLLEDGSPVAVGTKLSVDVFVEADDEYPGAEDPS